MFLQIFPFTAADGFMGGSVVPGSLMSAGQNSYFMIILIIWDQPLVPSYMYIPYFLVSGISIKYLRSNTHRERIQLIFYHIILMLIQLEETDLEYYRNTLDVILCFCSYLKKDKV